MPIVNITMSKVEKGMKHDIISKVTDTMHEVTGIPSHAFTVIIDEKEEDNIGIGGQPLSLREK